MFKIVVTEWTDLWSMWILFFETSSPIKVPIIALSLSPFRKWGLEI